METIFFFLGKMLFCSTVFFGYYLIFLRDKTFHHYNRFYLISVLLLSIGLPLIKVEYFTIEADARILQLLPSDVQQRPFVDLSTMRLWNVVFYTLAFVSFALVLRLLFGIFRILKLKKLYPRESVKGISFYNTNLETAPFSYFRNLFWKNSIPLNSEVGKQILKHEMVHIEQKHSIDKLLTEVVQSIFWMNPIFYLIKKEIHLIHEYLADKKAVQHSDTRAFAQMLLQSHFAGSTLPASSPFLSSNLKKRLKMISKTKTKYSYARRALALPILGLVTFTFVVKAKNTEIQKQNKEIAVAFAGLKNDTIKPENIQKIVEMQKQHVKKFNEDLTKNQQKAKILEGEIEKKAEELKSVLKEKGDQSFEYELKSKELENLGKEIEERTSKKKIIELKMISPSGERIVMKDSKAFPSLEFTPKVHVEDFKKMKTEPSEFNTRFKSLDMEKIPYVPRQKNVVVEATLFELKDDKNWSTAERKQVEKLQKMQEKLAKQQKKLAKQQVELIKQQVEISKKLKTSKPTNISFFKSLSDGNSKNIDVQKVNRVYVNGIPLSDEELNKIVPNDIKNIRILKTDSIKINLK